MGGGAKSVCGKMASIAAECIINKCSDRRVNASDGNVNDINAATRAGNIYALLIRTAAH